jgi:hypothetical protein
LQDKIAFRFHLQGSFCDIIQFAGQFRHLQDAGANLQDGFSPQGGPLNRCQGIKISRSWAFRARGRDYLSGDCIIQPIPFATAAQDATKRGKRETILLQGKNVYTRL